MSARPHARTTSLLLGLCLAAPTLPAAAQATSSSPQGQGRIVYQATPADEAAGEAGGPPTVPTTPAVTSAGGVAPAAAGPGVEIITGGGGGSPGAAKVGRMPVLQ